MILLQVLDILGSITGILGAILVGKKKYQGYALFLLCNLCYGILGYIEGHIGLVCVSIVMALIDIYYWRQWKLDK